MDSQLKEMILNCTLKAFKITHVEKSQRASSHHRVIWRLLVQKPQLNKSEQPQETEVSAQVRVYPRLVSVPVPGPDISSHPSKPSVRIPANAMI